MMSKEALVFTSCHCVDEHFGDVLEFDEAALRTQRSGKAGDQLWGSSIDLRGVLENLMAQFEINNLRVLVVVVNNYSAGSGDHKNEHQEQDSE